MTKGSKADERKQEKTKPKENEKLSLEDKKYMRESFMEYLASVINIDREILYIKYAKMLFDKTSRIFNVNITPSVSLETNRAEAPEAMMRILSENRIMDNIVYEIFSSVLIPPEEFYLRNLTYVDNDDDEDSKLLHYKKVAIKFDGELMDHDYADFVTKHNKDAMQHMKDLDEVDRFQEAQKHPEQEKQNYSDRVNNVLQGMLDDGTIEKFKEEFNKTHNLDDIFKITDNSGLPPLSNEALFKILKAFDLATDKKKDQM